LEESHARLTQFKSENVNPYEQILAFEVIANLTHLILGLLEAA